MTFAYVDIETTGLDLINHDVFEIAWAIDDGPINEIVVPHEIDGAEPKALEVNGYYERNIPHQATLTALREANWRERVLRALRGQTVVGSNPGFDVARLRLKLGTESWHYRTVDVSAVGSYLLGFDTPLGLAKLVELLNKGGYTIPENDHTAAKDVFVTREVHRALREMAASELMIETVRYNIRRVEEAEAEETGE